MSGDLRRADHTRHWRTLVVALLLVVATGGAGVAAVVNATKLGGWTHAQMSTMSIPPQAAYVMEGARQTHLGPDLDASTSGTMAVSFVVPRDHDPAKPLTMRVSYAVSDADACSWRVRALGVVGPDGPNTVDNVNAAPWTVSNSSGGAGLLTVPAGEGEAHVATFRWEARDDPGMFNAFMLTREGASADDTCDDVRITGLRLQY